MISVIKGSYNITLSMIVITKKNFNIKCIEGSGSSSRLGGKSGGLWKA